MTEHTAEEWAHAFDLKKKGREWIGPCPLCGGEDRFHVREHGAKVLVGCRGCIDGRDSTEKHQRYGELLTVLNGSTASARRDTHWYDDHASRNLIHRHKRNLTTRNRTPPHTPTRFQSQPRQAEHEEQERTKYAKDLWNMAQAADGTPARVYLADRLVWPPDGIGPALPENVRWLRRHKTDKLHNLPHGAAGYLLFALRSHPTTSLRGVSCEALTSNGQRLDRLPGRHRWRRTHGVKKDAAFVVNAGTPNLLLVEGEADALAAFWLYPDHEVWAVGGTGGLKSWRAPLDNNRPVRIVIDGDSKGREAGELARSAARAAGHQVIVDWCPVGHDLADELAEALAERMGILEADLKVTREEAKKLAWQQLLETT